MTCRVSVPVRGFLLLLLVCRRTGRRELLEVSVPVRGFLLLLRRGASGFGKRRRSGFSPREGIFAFATREPDFLKETMFPVSVPVRGFLLLLHGSPAGGRVARHRFSPREGIFAFATEASTQDCTMPRGTANRFQSP